jgi:NADH dehydrogenase (ubiquinone) 1 beta subcomplex subunit 8
MFSPDLPHTNIEPRQALAQASLAFAGFAAIMTFLAYTRPENPAVRRTYPRDGLKDDLGGVEVVKVGLFFMYNPKSVLTSS